MTICHRTPPSCDCVTSCQSRCQHCHLACLYVPLSAPFTHPFPPIGPLNSGDVAAAAQGGPVGAAQTYSVTGSLTLDYGTGGPPSANMFDMAAVTEQADPGWSPTEPTNGGPFGNTGLSTQLFLGVGRVWTALILCCRRSFLVGVAGSNCLA